ncbi:MAG: DUF615 domain-containing protein [Nitrospirae bacterium]|nr:DUF615 domain-containing protein [Nitrospirota bacterium]
MEFKSKTQKKKEALSLQKLGEKLVKLSAEQISYIDMPKEILEAVTFAKKIRSHGALKRQMQYIGTLMRNVDSGPIEEAVSKIEAGTMQNTEAFKETERLREELIGGNDALMEEILIKLPEAECGQFIKLVRSARNEILSYKPPRASRALFRYLKNLSA